MMRIAQGLAAIILVLILVLHFGEKINLTNSDIGRHLKNGELALHAAQKPLRTNLYSYTHQDFPVINHHWGAGVIFYLVFKAAGFTGLSWFYIGLLLLSVALFFELARRMAGWNMAMLVTLVCLPMLAQRTEIRPEGISAVLMGLYMLLLWLYKARALDARWLIVLPVVQLIWVNTHIFFFMGLFILAVFLLDAFFFETDRTRFKKLLYAGLASVAVCLINPNGLAGALVPFNIFKTYGYMLAENASVFFMQKRFSGNPLYLHFEIVLAVTVIALALSVWKKGWKDHLVWLVLTLVFAALACKTNRAISVFGYIAMPVLAFCAGQLLSGAPDKIHRRVNTGALWLSVAVIFLCIAARNHYYAPYARLSRYIPPQQRADVGNGFLYMLRRPHIWTGLMPRNDVSALFIRKLNIQGPIFNNYDIGGYLIYHLYPDYQFFVDNRPEAFPVEFFTETYVPMQEDEENWRRVDARYHFNVIYFYRHDMTPWAQPFLIRRIQDPEWAPVFADGYTLILLRRNAQNQRVIDMFEMPQSMFNIIQNP